MSLWYVDNAAEGTNDGTSWTNAWHAFAHIVWGAGGVVAGDTLYLSGGSVSKTYTEELDIGVSGTEGNRVTISVGQDAGHNGVAIISAVGGYGLGVYFTSKNYITLNGRVGTGTSRNLKITNAVSNGIDIEGSSTGWIISYVEVTENGSTGVGEVHGLMAQIGTINDVAFEISNCLFDNNWTDQIHLTYNTSTQTSTGFGKASIHNNIIQNTQDDGIECGIGGVDIYNNFFGPRSVWTGRTTGHPDMLQIYEKYYRIYNNTFYGIVNGEDGGGNSFLRWEPDSVYFTASGHIWIYNNLFYNTSNSVAGVERGIEISPFGFGAEDPTSMDDILIANNTLVRCWLMGLSMTLGTFNHAAVSNVIIENNIFLNTTNTSVGGISLGVEDGDGTVTYGVHGSGADVVIDYNLFWIESATYRDAIEAPDGTVYTTAAAFRTATGLDIHGVSADPLLDGSYYPQSGTPAIGVDLSAYFTTDKSGATRIAWNIGAYESSLTGAKLVMVLK